MWTLWPSAFGSTTTRVGPCSHGRSYPTIDATCLARRPRPMTVADMPPSLETETRLVAALVRLGPARGSTVRGRAPTLAPQSCRLRDLTDTFAGTMLIAVHYEGPRPDLRRVGNTDGGRIRQLAPTVSLSDWANALGVSPQAVSNWSKREPPDRPELAKVLGSLEEASWRRPAFGRWLKEPGPSGGPSARLTSWRTELARFRRASRLVPVRRSGSSVQAPSLRRACASATGPYARSRGPEPAACRRGR